MQVCRDDKWCQDLCCCVSEQARPDHIETMLRESCMMHGMSNAPNVNGILAACLRVPAQPLLIYPYADQGNLKKFLHKCKMSEIAAAYVSRPSRSGSKCFL